MTEITDRVLHCPRRCSSSFSIGAISANGGVSIVPSDQIFALLYGSEHPLTAEDIAETLGLARSNVSSSLRELQSWEIIRAASALRDRRSFYELETDPWLIVRRIASGRQSREPIRWSARCVNASKAHRAIAA
jgi:hypothetical protein